jgi:Tfp pilus assembly protein PilO
MATQLSHERSDSHALTPDVQDWRRFVRAVVLLLVAACAFFLRSALNEIEKLRDGQAMIRETLADQGAQLRAISRQLDQQSSKRSVR